MKIISFLLILLTIHFHTHSQSDDTGEMRAVWIATVKNIDFPLNKFSSVETQKKEYIDMLDYFSDIGINAVIFQIRPAADAFYDSEFEPWSEWLTGKQGQAPEPYYDPLKFYIEEAHKREIEFHAWINPFRAVATIEFADIADDHITKRKPEWFFKYDIHKYFNPGIPEVREYILEVIRDIVKRYDIDGVHFDDYFYPYPVRNSRRQIIRIKDTDTYFKYNTDSLSIEDWRRSNMDTFIESVHLMIKEEKPDLPFGVAPSGVWRNKSSDPDGSDTRGLAHYDYLYADVLKWLREGWIDYVAPQLYWPIGNKLADYETLVKWWGEHTYGRHLYIGHGLYQAGRDAQSPGWREQDQLIRQMNINRANPNVKGSIFYKARSLMNNPFGFCDSLKTGYYSMKVETPDMPWLGQVDTFLVADAHTDSLLVEEPDGNNEGFEADLFITKLGKQFMLSWDSIPGDNIRYCIYRSLSDETPKISQEYLFVQTKDHYLILDKKKPGHKRRKYSVMVTAVNAFGTVIRIGEIKTVKMPE
jgi:uncharacterized lipoprotein YddW (UPF0748 family)